MCHSNLAHVVGDTYVLKGNSTAEYHKGGCGQKHNMCSKDRYDILLWGLFLFEGVIQGEFSSFCATGTMIRGSLV